MDLRPSTDSDRDRILALLAARDQADFGEPDFTASLLLDQWRSREFDPQCDAVVAEDAGAIVGYAASFEPGDLGFVDPAREGEGIGSALLRWTEEQARPRNTFRQRPAAGNRPARALLESTGYRRVRSVHCLAWDGHPALPAAGLPGGFTMTPIVSPQDARVMHEIDLRAFSQNPDYHAEPFEGFVDEHLSSPDLHQPSSCIARQGERPVGFVLSRRVEDRGYIDLLAVLDDVRRLGIGRALLCHALGMLAEAGVTETRLDVSSDNPRALQLYRSVGMVDRHAVAVYEKPAPPGLR